MTTDCQHTDPASTYLLQLKRMQQREACFAAKIPLSKDDPEDNIYCGKAAGFLQ